MPCATPAQHDGQLYLSELAYQWPDDQTCAFTCVPPYVHTETRQLYNYTQPTCVHCNTSICQVGEFLTGRNCDECKPCVLVHALDVEEIEKIQAIVDTALYATNSTHAVDNRTLIIATTAGALDGPNTCAEACVQGFYAPLGNLGNGCMRHTNLTEEECGVGYWLRAGEPTRDASCA